jgi:hypothetical protein
MVEVIYAVNEILINPPTIALIPIELAIHNL